ncbi:nuclear receptor coactivator 7 isoform X2 [Callorhinchus milii]|uniref:nuclear receptor coactivator 7 isoform X2 n=1 Tax=Callorhinchus milii TaxID=7868 RepID=UPI001C3FD035|nr:nuclear receptor coactivator 7 isoform X2 [Callorhinchus milii]
MIIGLLGMLNKYYGSSRSKEKNQDYISGVRARIKKKFKQTKTTCTTSISSPGTERRMSKAAFTRKKSSASHTANSPSKMSQTGRIRNPDLRRYYSMDSLPDKKAEKSGRRLIHKKPEGTIEYTAAVDDSLCSIALKFNTTPNQLAQLNKLYSHSIVPGQRIYVLDPGISRSDHSPMSSSHSQSLSLSDAEYDKLLDADSVKMSTVQQCSSEPSTEHSSFPTQDTNSLSERFLKICCKYFTDRKGVVKGVLLVTPKKILFDPYKSHPLVKENGCEDYFFACSMASIISANCHTDVSRMKFRVSSPLRKVTVETNSSQYKPTGRNIANTVQRKARRFNTPIQIKAKPQCAEMNEAHLFPGSKETPLAKIIGVSYSCPDSLCQANEKSLDEIAVLQDCVMCLDLEENGTIGNKEILPFDGKVKCGGDNLISQNGLCSTRQKNPEDNTSHGHQCILSSKLRKEGLYEQKELEILCDSVNSADNKDGSFWEIRLSDEEHASVLSARDSEHDLEKTKEELFHTELSSRGLKVQDVCSLMNSSRAKDQLTAYQYSKQDSGGDFELPTLKEKRGLTQELQDAKEDEVKLRMMFLCLKVRVPLRRSSLVQFGVPVPRNRCQQRSEEFWFAMSQEKVDELHQYLKQWRPEIYSLERMDDAQVDDFVLLERKCGFSLPENVLDGLFEDWEIITVEDNPLNQYDIFETEFGYVEPVLEGSSNLMETFHIEKISRHLPPRTVGHPWRLAYNTSLHGFSLKTLYRKVAKVDSPVLLILKDTHSQVFGALTSHPPKSSDLFFGTGETFLFTFNPDFKWPLRVVAG